MQRNYVTALLLFTVSAICLSSITGHADVLDTGHFRFDTSNLRTYRAGSDSPVALALRPASIYIKGHSWVNANLKGPYIVESNGERTTVIAKSSNECFDTVVKYVVVKGSPAMLVDMEYTANKEFHCQRGSAPSVDFPVNLTKLALPERDPILLERDGKQVTYQLRTWALFSEENAEKDAILVVIPSLDDYDFSGGGRITCGGYRRGHGWRPGMDLSHPDFQLNDFAKGDKGRSRIILVFTNGKADCARLFQDAVKTFQTELKAE
ncbi:MAG: hypothetical protein IJJ33_05985 [Victivallales bacterium]|nr:hypothetical protein [Victivallales bacterium]